MGQWLLVIGFILILIELFIPGFGVFGISGIISILVSIVLLSPNIYYAVFAILFALALLALIFFFVIKDMSKKNLYRTLFLGTKLKNEDGFISSKENDLHLGEIMLVDTFLRPSGKVKKDGNVYDAMSEGEFIQKDEQVVVVGNKGYILIVKRLKDLV